MRISVASALLAVAGAVLSVPTSADVSISGFTKQDIGFGSYDGGEETVDDIHFEIDAEIHFKATGVTDGGLGVEAVVEMEAGANGGIDESYLTLSGGFGALTIGQEDSAASLLGFVGIGGGYGGGGYYDCGENWTPASCDLANANNDYLGIRYITPVIGGLQAGVSYQLDTHGSHVGHSTSGSYNDTNLLSAGANFVGNSSGTSWKIGGNYLLHDTGENAEKATSWGIGAGATVGGTTLSVQYDIVGNTHGNPVSNALEDSRNFGIGVDHTVGALTFGIGIGTKLEKNASRDSVAYTFIPANSLPGVNEPLATAVYAGAQDRKHTTISSGAAYNLGGGLEVSAGIHHGKVNNLPWGSDRSVCILANTADGAADGSGMVDPDQSVPNDDGECGSGAAKATYTTLKTLDDVGVGLRIAFSF